MAKTAKTTEATETTLSDICANPTIDLSPVRKEAKSATFTGTLAFNLMSFPVKTYKATDEDSINYNQVHKCGDTHVQLKQGAMHCSLCNVDVPKDQILKGFNLGNEKAPKFLAVSQDDVNGITTNRPWRLLPASLQRS